MLIFHAKPAPFFTEIIVKFWESDFEDGFKEPVFMFPYKEFHCDDKEIRDAADSIIEAIYEKMEILDHEPDVDDEGTIYYQVELYYIQQNNEPDYDNLGRDFVDAQLDDNN